MSSEQRAAYVAALKAERHDCEVHDKKERVAAIDAELAKFDAAPMKRTAAKRTTAAKDE